MFEARVARNDRKTARGTKREWEEQQSGGGRGEGGGPSGRMRTGSRRKESRKKYGVRIK